MTLIKYVWEVIDFNGRYDWSGWTTGRWQYLRTNHLFPTNDIPLQREYLVLSGDVGNVIILNLEKLYAI